MKTPPIVDPVALQRLAEIITHPQADEYFGPSFALRLAVVIALDSGAGETLASVARRHGASRQAAHRHGLRARRTILSNAG